MSEFSGEVVPFFIDLQEHGSLTNVDVYNFETSDFKSPEGIEKTAQYIAKVIRGSHPDSSQYQAHFAYWINWEGEDRLPEGAIIKNGEDSEEASRFLLGDNEGLVFNPKNEIIGSYMRPRDRDDNLLPNQILIFRPLRGLTDDSIGVPDGITRYAPEIPSADLGLSNIAADRVNNKISDPERGLVLRQTKVEEIVDDDQGRKVSQPTMTRVDIIASNHQPYVDFMKQLKNL